MNRSLVFGFSERERRDRKIRQGLAQDERDAYRNAKQRARITEIQRKARRDARKEVQGERFGGRSGFSGLGTKVADFSHNVEVGAMSFNGFGMSGLGRSQPKRKTRDPWADYLR